MSHQFHQYSAGSYAAGPGDQGPSTLTAVGVAVGVLAVINGVMYFLGNQDPTLPTFASAKKQLGFGALSVQRLPKDLLELADSHGASGVTHNDIGTPDDHALFDFSSRTNAQQFYDAAKSLDTDQPYLRHARRVWTVKVRA